MPAGCAGKPQPAAIAASKYGATTLLELERLWQPRRYSGSFGNLATAQMRKYLERLTETLVLFCSSEREATEQPVAGT